MAEIEDKIHPPKHLLSIDGLGLPNTIKVIKTLTPTSIILEQTWQEMVKPWNQGDTIIAKPGYKWISRWEEGENYIMTKMLDEKGNLVGFYCDICDPVRKNEDGFESNDWYLDVWKPANQLPQLLDEDELEDAIEAGYLTEEQANIARQIASQLMIELKSTLPDF